MSILKNIYEGFGGKTAYYNPSETFDNHKSICPDFEVYPTIIPHHKRVIAIGDIHGDMNLAINFLKAAKVIKEVNEDTFKNYHITEYIYRLKILNNSVGLKEEKVDGIPKAKKNEIDVVYRFYKIGNEYYVKMVDDNLKVRWFKWTGEKTYVVQVGDQVDRCRPYDNKKCTNKSVTVNDEDSDLEIMLFYDSLDKIASKVGGRVFSLLGNHEIMNVTGDMRYVSYKGLSEFSNTGDINKDIYIRTDKFKDIIAKKMACTRSTILVIGDYIFVHGGIAHKLASKYNIFDINSIIRKFLFGPIPESHNIQKDIKRLLNSSKLSPLWYRRLAYIPPDSVVGNKKISHPDCKAIYDPIIKKVNKNNYDQIIATNPTIQIKGMVIGHTPQFTVFNQGITTACNDKLIRADVGASQAFDAVTQIFDSIDSNTSKLNKQNNARYPQVVEIITDLNTKESTVKILYY